MKSKCRVGNVWKWQNVWLENHGLKFFLILLVGFRELSVMMRYQEDRGWEVEGRSKQ